MDSVKTNCLLVGLFLSACAGDDAMSDLSETAGSSGPAPVGTTVAETDEPESTTGSSSSAESPDESTTSMGTGTEESGGDSTGSGSLDPRPFECSMSPTDEIVLAPAPEHGVTRELDIARDADGVWFAYATWDTAPEESNRRSVRAGHVSCAGRVDQESKAVASGGQSHWYPRIAANGSSVAVAWVRADISTGPSQSNRSGAFLLFDATDFSTLTDPVELPLLDTLSPPDIAAIDDGFRVAWIASDSTSFEEAVWSRDLTLAGAWLGEPQSTLVGDEFPSYVTLAERSGWVAFSQGFGEGVRVWNPVLDTIGTVQAGREIQLQIHAAAHLSDDGPPLLATRGQPSSDFDLPDSILLSYGTESSVVLGDPEASDVGLGLAVTPQGDVAVAYVQETENDGLLFFQRLRITESGLLELVGKRQELGPVQSYARLAVEWMDDGWFVAWPREDAVVGRVLAP
ncbi:MAG: hypothetical protein AAGA54_29610 [Myxococcota bacterium]